MDQFVQQIVTGLSIGSILLLVALGLSIIYGSMGIINLAHGEFVMLGAYAAWTFQHYFGLGLLESLVPIFLVVAICGWLIERYVLSFLNNRPLDTILATWGVGIILQQGVRLLVGGELRYVQLPDSLSDSTELLGVQVPVYRIFLFFAALALFALTWLLMNRTMVGMKLRAIIQDRAIAAVLRRQRKTRLCADVCLWGRARRLGRGAGFATEKRVTRNGHWLCSRCIHGRGAWRRSKSRRYGVQFFHSR